MANNRLQIRILHPVSNKWELLDVESGVNPYMNVSALDVGEIGNSLAVEIEQIDLLKTQTNAQLLGFLENDNTDAHAGFYDYLPCRVAIDGVHLFEGTLTIERINVNEVTGETSYEVVINNNLDDLATKLENINLKDLDFSDLDHTFNFTNIQNSWSGTLKEGNVKYPLLDLGEDSGDFGKFSTDENADNTIFDTDTGMYERQFYPVIKLKWLVDAIFKESGYRYSSTFLESDFFGDLYVLHKPNDGLGAPYSATRAGQFRYSDPNSDGTEDTIAANSTTNINVQFPSAFTLKNIDSAVTTTGGISTYTAKVSGIHNMFGTIVVDSTESKTSKLQYKKGSDAWVDIADSETTADFMSFSLSIDLDTNDTLQFRVAITNSGSAFDLDEYRIRDFSVTPKATTLGETTDLSQMFDEETASELIVKGIFERFALKAEVDHVDHKLIHIEAYKDYIDSGDTKDWSKKRDLSAGETKAPIIQDLPETITLSDLGDDDSLNTYTQERFGRIHGSAELKSPSSLSSGDKEFGGYFAPLPMKEMYNEDNNSIVIPRLFAREDGEKKAIKLKPRLLYDNGLQDTSRVIEYRNGLAKTPRSDYYLMSHYSEWPPQPDTIDIHYENQYDYFEKKYSPYVKNDIKNEYWRDYLVSLYATNVRRVTRSYYLTPKDIIEFSFNDLIYDSGQYYYVDKINGYSLLKGGSTEVELLLVPEPRLKYFKSGDYEIGDLGDDGSIEVLLGGVAQSNVDQGVINDLALQNGYYAVDGGVVWDYNKDITEGTSNLDGFSSDDLVQCADFEDYTTTTDATLGDTITNITIDGSTLTLVHPTVDGAQKAQQQIVLPVNSDSQSAFAAGLGVADTCFTYQQVSDCFDCRVLCCDFTNVDTNITARIGTNDCTDVDTIVQGDNIAFTYSDGCITIAGCDPNFTARIDGTDNTGLDTIVAGSNIDMSVLDGCVTICGTSAGFTTNIQGSETQGVDTIVEGPNVTMSVTDGCLTICGDAGAISSVIGGVETSGITTIVEGDNITMTEDNGCLTICAEEIQTSAIVEENTLEFTGCGSSSQVPATKAEYEFDVIGTLSDSTDDITRLYMVNDITFTGTNKGKYYCSSEVCNSIGNVGTNGNWAAGVDGLDDTCGTDVGAIYVFKYSSTNDDYDCHQKIVPTDLTSSDDLGSVEAMDSNRIIISSNDGCNGGGCLYVYEYNSASDEWDCSVKLNESSGGNFFGREVGLYKDDLVVTGPGRDSWLYYSYNETDDTFDCIQEVSISSSRVASPKIFCDRLLVGDVYDNSCRGALYAYCYNTTDNDWDCCQKLVPSEIEVNEYFGCVISMSYTWAAVSSWSEDSCCGAVYIYCYNSTSENWECNQRIQPDSLTSGDRFGCYLCISGDKLFISSSSTVLDTFDTTQLYCLVNGTWTLCQDIGDAGFMSYASGKLISDGDYYKQGCEVSATLTYHTSGGTQQTATFTCEGLFGDLSGPTAMLTCFNNHVNGSTGTHSSTLTAVTHDEVSSCLLTIDHDAAVTDATITFTDTTLGGTEFDNSEPYDLVITGGAAAESITLTYTDSINNETESLALSGAHTNQQIIDCIVACIDSSYFVISCVDNNTFKLTACTAEARASAPTFVSDDTDLVTSTLSSTDNGSDPIDDMVITLMNVDGVPTFTPSNDSTLSDVVSELEQQINMCSTDWDAEVSNNTCIVLTATSFGSKDNVTASVTHQDSSYSTLVDTTEDLVNITGLVAGRVDCATYGARVSYVDGCITNIKSTKVDCTDYNSRVTAVNNCFGTKLDCSDLAITARIGSNDCTDVDTIVQGDNMSFTYSDGCITMESHISAEVGGSVCTDVDQIIGGNNVGLTYSNGCITINSCNPIFTGKDGSSTFTNQDTIVAGGNVSLSSSGSELTITASAAPSQGVHICTGNFTLTNAHCGCLIITDATSHTCVTFTDTSITSGFFVEFASVNGCDIYLDSGVSNYNKWKSSGNGALNGGRYLLLESDTNTGQAQGKLYWDGLNAYMITHSRVSDVNS